MKQTLKIIAISALATAAVLRTVPALSQPVSDQNVSIVRTSDLDLSTKSGRATLHHRLVIAAREACDAASDVDLVGQNVMRSCRAHVLAKAGAQRELAVGAQSVRSAAAAR